MAVVQYGALIQDARGSIGGVTFARVGGTSCVRQRPLKTKSRTVGVEAARARYARVTAAWSTLSESERETWRAGAFQGNQSGAFEPPSSERVFVVRSRES